MSSVKEEVGFGLSFVTRTYTVKLFSQKREGGSFGIRYLAKMVR